ncbi:MAG: efflux RND transporter periplasmic adaptor subunit [Rubripirellula sp.]
MIGDTSRPEVESDQRLVIAAGEEASAQTHRFHWAQPSSNKDANASRSRVGLLAVAQLAKSLHAHSIEGLPLQCEEELPRGVVLVIDAEQRTEGNWLELMVDPVATKLASIEMLQPSAFESVLRAIASWGSNARRSWMIAVSVIFLTVLLAPVPYHVQAELEIQPTVRRYVAVPFEGSLQQAHVRPGDTVREQELLAEIDPREIEFELAGINAELQRARQEQKGLLAERDVAGSQIAGWESKRLENASDLLELRRENLEIRSPIAGVVVRGDWKQSEGMPMSRGDTLFEIAPLNELVVEIAVPEEDVHHVRDGMRVEFFVNAMPGRTLEGLIIRVHPSAELREHENVYIAELSLRNPEGVYRPGMRGRARIVSDRHTLAWNVFHKPWHAFRHVVGW